VLLLIRLVTVAMNMAVRQGATATKSHEEALHDGLVLFLRERLADVRKVGQETGLLVRIVGRAACSNLPSSRLVWAPMCRAASPHKRNGTNVVLGTLRGYPSTPLFIFQYRCNSCVLLTVLRQMCHSIQFDKRSVGLHSRKGRTNVIICPISPVGRHCAWSSVERDFD
jgi:hypothetical protein